MANLVRSSAPRFTTAVYNSLGPSSYVPIKGAALGEKPVKDKNLHASHSEGMSTEVFRKAGLFSSGYRATKVALGSSQVRCSHTDLTFPNFDEYRRNSTKDPTKKSHDTDDQRRSFTYLAYGAAGVMGMYVGKMTVHEFVEMKSMAKDVQATASIEVKISDIEEGQSKTFEWRGKPVFVRHRSSADVDNVRTAALGELRDPQKDQDRVQKDDWLVVIGICTHLGCVPIANASEYRSGYYCPCHGSHYDASGRIRKGPAPSNLEIPEYYFKTDDMIVIGATE